MKTAAFNQEAKIAEDSMQMGKKKRDRIVKSHCRVHRQVQAHKQLFVAP